MQYIYTKCYILYYYIIYTYVIVVHLHVATRAVSMSNFMVRQLLLALSVQC